MDKIHIFTLTIGLLISCGCSGSPEGPQLYSVSGYITYAGAPLAEGSILFKAADGKSESYFASIKDGQYSTEIEPGSRDVMITANKEIPGKMVPDAAGTGMEPAVEQYIPAKYNAQTTLKVTVQTDDNQIDFDLEQ